MPVPFFDLKRQISNLRPDLIQSVSDCIDSGSFILGPRVAELESLISNYIGVKHSVAVASGTDALHLSLHAINIKPGDEIITSPFTFVATAEAIAYCGAHPVFVDIEPNTFNIDSQKLTSHITKKTKAIIVVHLYGQSCDMTNISDICANFKLKLIEDCAQSIGSKYNQHMTGSFGQCGCFSFFPTKNLGCFGDGGIITSNDDALADSLRALRGHGSRITYHYDMIGYNSRLDALQAALLLVRLKHLDNWNRLRRHNANLYHKCLKGVDRVILPLELPNAFHVFNQFTIRAQDRNGLFEYLKTKGVGSMVYYPLSLHLQKAFSYLGYKPGDFPESEKAQDEVLSLPIFPELMESEIEEVCQRIKEFYGQG
jgi:dTDP-4-amino-4,6-dideoxygalactose transaminase